MKIKHHHIYLMYKVSRINLSNESISKKDFSSSQAWKGMLPVDLTAIITLFHWKLLSHWKGMTVNWHDCSNNFIQSPTSFKLGRKSHLLIWQLKLFYFIGNFYHTWQGLPLTDLTVQIILFGWQRLSNLEGKATCWSGGYNCFILFATYITVERNYYLLIW